MWVGGSVLAVIAIFAAAYFLLIGPVMDSTADTDNQREQVEAQNTTLRTQNATLQGQFSRINELRAGLNDLHKQIPDHAGWDSYTTMVGGMANTNGVVVTSINGGSAIAIGGATLAPPPADGEATDGTNAPVVASGMALPVTIAFQGPRDGALAMVNDLQQVDQRLVLVQTIEIKGLQPTEAAVPPVAPGDVGVVINGYLLIQPPVTTVPGQKPPAPISDSQFAPSS